MNDVVINKKSSIERCISQIKTYFYLESDIAFENDYLRQDAVAMNVQRACEQALDLANYVIRDKKLGVPATSRESFEILAKNKFISQLLSEKLQRMVGFRNILVHEYQQVNVEILLNIVRNDLDDFFEFTNQIIKNY